MAAPGRPTLKRALESATNCRQEDHLRKLVDPDGALDVPADFLRKAQTDWEVMAQLRRSEGHRRG